MPGGGPQGCYLGGIEYTSQSNSSGRCVPAEDRYKFVDDLSLLEIINLITIGLTSYNFKNHVASDIAIGDSFLPPNNIQSQNYLDSIEEWTDNKKMKLNQKKSKIMIFNFTRNYQFGTRLYLENQLLETVQETKLLGTIISSDLTWWQNTNHLTKKGYQRLEILKKLYEFDVPEVDLVQIYTLYVRSILEFNSCVWHFNITQGENNDIKRVHKIVCKVILKENYTSYSDALGQLGLQTLSARRQTLCHKFAIKCLKYNKSKDMFPIDENRNAQNYKVNFARHSRLLDSAIPQMQRLLNQD